MGANEMEHRRSHRTAEVDRAGLASGPILERYMRVYRSLLLAESVDDRSVVISFPLHLAANHRIEITITKAGKNRYLLSDGARTLGEVQDAGHSVTEQMKNRLASIAGAEINIVEDHLVMEASAKELGASIQKFLETSKMIGDVYLVHKHRAEPESGIVSQVRRALESKHLLYREREKLQGQIESHAFDLLVPPNGHAGLAVGILSGQNTHTLAQIWGYKCDDIRRIEGNRSTKGNRNNNLNKPKRYKLRARVQCVIPVRMRLVATDAQCVHLGLGYLDPYFILIGVEHGLHPKSTFGLRGTDQVHHRLIVDQRLSFPGQTDERE
jgi:hypothetical protein